MWWMLAAQTGMNFLQAGMQYDADKQQHKAQVAWQKYSNTMVRLSDAMNQNAITTNELLTQEAFANEAMKIKRGSLLTLAKVETAAAAAGTKGRSVNQAMLDVTRNAAVRESERQTSLRNANLAFDQQRLQSGMSAAMQLDYTYLPKPNAASYFLKAAASSMGTSMDMGMGGSGGSGGGGGSYQRISNPNIAGTNYLL